jgi:hypothetical protein
MNGQNSLRNNTEDRQVRKEAHPSLIMLPVRQYNFTYDASNRVTAADFNQYTSGSFNKTAGLDFSVSRLNYDVNGNITALQQKGWKVNASPVIDNLGYTYIANSNKLASVTDTANDLNTKLGDFRDGNTVGNDYTYPLIKNQKTGFPSIESGG